MLESKCRCLRCFLLSGEGSSSRTCVRRALRNVESRVLAYATGPGRGCDCHTIADCPAVLGVAVNRLPVPASNQHACGA